MTRDEHIERILQCLAEGVGLELDNPALAPLRNILFVLIDKAVVDGIRQGRYEQTENPSCN